MNGLARGAPLGALALCVALGTIALHAAQYLGDSREFFLVVLLARVAVALLGGAAVALAWLVLRWLIRRRGTAPAVLFAGFGLATAAIALAMVVAGLLSEVPRPLVYLFGAR